MEIKQSKYWKLVCDEIDKRTADQYEQLLLVPPDKLVEVQLKLKNLAEFKRLPDDVIEREKP